MKVVYNICNSISFVVLVVLVVVVVVLAVVVNNSSSRWVQICI